MKVRAKKSLGQHFLTNEGIARRIADALVVNDDDKLNTLEVGCGTGALTRHLLQRDDLCLKGIEIDDESIEYLRENLPAIMPNLYAADFLKTDLRKIFPEGDFAVIGNFPYNISSQIFFKILDYRESVPQVVGMLQKEVAERLASGPGNKSYGILSVLLQAWYDIEYLFTVGEHEFSPPPKVKSAVIRLRRNSRTELGCDEAKFKTVIKTAFNQRRKTLRNSLKPLGTDVPEQFAGLRPEQLSVEEFITLCKSLE
ncbi:MAG: 16S rRNA (adenine(1518)-N(6)/adenine(1519)-N(6))-dimethyltransferase RsmA [Bacteroidales bacterium]|nr:16S rRNA (adenine(1518)-N(6)/adenine(1519)-N(6))-dimethyltransferase RsmA [Bacteroidales bacterium]